MKRPADLILVMATGCIIGGLWFAGAGTAAHALFDGWWQLAGFVGLTASIVGVAWLLVACAHRGDDGRAYLAPWQDREPGPLEDAPCRGVNSNVCVAEGCYGEACLRVAR